MNKTLTKLVDDLSEVINRARTTVQLNLTIIALFFAILLSILRFDIASWSERIMRWFEKLGTWINSLIETINY